MQDYVSARLLIIFLWFFSAERTCGQIITNFVVPSTAFEGDSVYIICDYSLIKGQKLYTLKWYKEEQEFWRYEPRNRPKFQALNVTGISIERSMANSTHVLLKKLTKQSSGLYSCELSIEGTYMTIIRDGKLLVQPSTANTSRSLLFPSTATSILTIVLLVITRLLSFFTTTTTTCL